MTRVLRSKARDRLSSQLDTMDLAELARDVGIAKTTLQKMLNDHWDFLPRDAIERLCDYLDCGLDGVFEMVPDGFWSSVDAAKTCIFLRAPEKDESDHRRVARFDQSATVEIVNLLSSSIPGFNSWDEHDLLDEASLLERTRNYNCIVIGSCRSNPAAEILISRLYGAEPFNGNPSNRAKIPFGFVFPPDDPLAQTSALAAPGDGSGNFGLRLREGRFLGYSDYWPPSWYFTHTITSGRDCGLFLVTDRPFKAEKDIKLIICAGFSGVGTLAVTKGVIHHFRNLQPRLSSEPAWGVVQANFRKPTRTTDKRELKKFHWKYLTGAGKIALANAGTSDKQL
jgi:DNA-binding Xre family transcriptional regulator